MVNELCTVYIAVTEKVCWPVGDLIVVNELCTVYIVTDKVCWPELSGDLI